MPCSDAVMPEAEQEQLSGLLEVMRFKMSPLILSCLNTETDFQVLVLCRVMCFINLLVSANTQMHACKCIRLTIALVFCLQVILHRLLLCEEAPQGAGNAELGAAPIVGNLGLLMSCFCQADMMQPSLRRAVAEQAVGWGCEALCGRLQQTASHTLRSNFKQSVLTFMAVCCKHRCGTSSRRALM